MKRSDYEDFVKSSAKIGLDDLNYSVIGLCGEAGEVAEWHKKRNMRGNPKFTEEMLVSELGDVLHYLTRIALKYGVSLDDVMKANVAKLITRQAKDLKDAAGYGHGV